MRSEFAARLSRRGAPSSERMISRNRMKYAGLFILTRKYLTDASAYLFRYLTSGLRQGEVSWRLFAFVGSCDSSRMVSATRPGRSFADSRNLLADGGSRWNSSIIAAAIFCSSPGRQLFWAAASFSGSSHFFRWSTSFSPSVSLKWFPRSFRSRRMPFRRFRVRWVCTWRLYRMGRRLCCRESRGIASFSTMVASPRSAASTTASLQLLRCLKSSVTIRAQMPTFAGTKNSSSVTAALRRTMHSSRTVDGGASSLSPSLNLTTSCKKPMNSGPAFWISGGSA